MKKFLSRKLSIVIFTLFLDSLGFGILIPIVPLLLTDSSSSFYILSAGASVKEGYISLGLLTAIFPLMQLFSASVLGQLSDRLGRKPILMYTLFGTAVSYALFAFGIHIKNIPLLFIARALAGVTSGNLSVAQASIADVTLPQDRVKNFGLIGAAFGIGFILGPFIGGKLSDPNVYKFFNPTLPFYFAALLSLINSLSVKFNFKETNPRALLKIKKLQITWGKAIVNILKAFQIKNLKFLYLTNFIFFSGFTFFVAFMGVYLIKKFGFTQGGIADFFSFLGFWMVFTQAIVTRQVARYFDERQVLRITLICDGIFIGLLYFVEVWWVIFLIAPLIAVCNGISFANIIGLISRTADQKIQGEILGINASIQALAQLIPPVLSGFIAASFTPETPIIVASVIIIFAGILFVTLYRPRVT